MPFDFNVQEYAGEDWGSGEFTLLPTGTYVLKIKDFEHKENSKKNGRLFQIQFEVASGDFQGHEFRHWITSHHENSKAERMGRAELADVCRVLQVAQPEQWMNQVLLADITLIAPKKNDQGETTKQGKNKIKEYRPYGQPGAAAGGPPPPSQPAVQQPPPQQPTYQQSPQYQQPVQQPPQQPVQHVVQPAYTQQVSPQPMTFGGQPTHQAPPQPAANPHQPAPPAWTNAAPA